MDGPSKKGGQLNLGGYDDAKHWFGDYVFEVATFMLGDQCARLIAHTEGIADAQHPARTPEHEAIAIPQHAVTLVGFQLFDREQFPGHVRPTRPTIRCWLGPYCIGRFWQSGRLAL